MRKKGFSVFSPMVGVIVITIAIHIASSIINSEKVSMAGTFQSYQTLERTVLQESAKNRIQEKLRAGILKDVTDRMHIYLGEQQQCILTEDGPVDPDATDVDNEDEYYCENMLKTETSNYILGQLASGLSYSKEIEDIISSLPGKKSLYKIEFNQALHEADPDDEDAKGFHSTIKGVEYVDCESGSLNDCRMKINVDYRELSGVPIAEVITDTARLEIFLEDAVREYLTPAPYGLYAHKIGEHFATFSILDPTWHGAGGIPAGSLPKEYAGEKSDSADVTNGYYGDGSQWYHYKYALQQRKPGTAGLTEWTQYPDTSDYSLDNVNVGTGNDVVIPSITTKHPEAKDKPVDLGEWLDDEWSSVGGKSGFSHADDTFFDDYLRDYERGVGKSATIGCDETTMETRCKGVATGASSDAFAGGKISGSYGNIDGGIGNCIPVDDDIEIEATESNGVVTHTVNDYDKKVKTAADAGPLRELAEEIQEELADTSKAYKSAIGFSTGQAPIVSVEVDSYQFYTSAKSMEGGDNWYCGQYLLGYVPYVASYDDDHDSDLGASATPALTQIKDTCEPVLNDYGENAMFASFPLPFECRTYTMYAVHEVYRVRRNTPQEPEKAGETVYIGDLKSYKTALPHYPDDWREEDEYNALWEGAEVLESTNINYLMPEQPMIVRHCTYSYETGQDDIGLECEWPSNNAEEIEGLAGKPALAKASTLSYLED
ncbi:MAG: hypothetical protein DRP08_04370 [Candidatus Aenigmatarchaeota archaeon]|nr:MAG: hypothetical protein DRP08_04370 [Candidatus Aenigmarchaeota archaeon]